MKNKIIVLIIVITLIVVIIAFLLIKKKINKNKKESKPILKEYDPIIEEQLKQDNSSINIGKEAQPIIEMQEEIPQKEVEPIVEEKIVEEKIVEEVKPLVSNENSNASKLNNYEVKFPEESLAKKMMDYTQANPVKKDPLFIHEEEKEKVEIVEPKRNEIVIDKPNADDIL